MAYQVCKREQVVLYQKQENFIDLLSNEAESTILLFALIEGDSNDTALKNDCEGDPQLAQAIESSGSEDHPP